MRIIPILVGATSPATELAFGSLLAPYLTDERTLFVVSSDFCHWSVLDHRSGLTTQGLPLSVHSLQPRDWLSRQSQLQLAGVDLCLAADLGLNRSVRSRGHGGDQLH